jgi:hypothetical protein
MGLAMSVWSMLEFDLALLVAEQPASTKGNLDKSPQDFLLIYI